MILRWLFRQSDRVLTCGVSRAEAAFEVMTVPHWDIKRASVERFSCAKEALQRHAEIAVLLRESPFYAESGGQISDRGEIVGEGWRMEVDDVRKVDGRPAAVGKVSGRSARPTPAFR